MVAVRAQKIPLPKKMFDSIQMKRALETMLDMAAEDVLIDFQTTTRTWAGHPIFVIKKKTGIREIYTEDKVYGFINQGTSVRHAVMSRDFKPKTRNRWVGSNKGRGGMVFVNRKVNRPGIEAREFDKEIQEKWDKELPTLLDRAISSVLSHR